ncbi:MAG TPA: hypothetical protein DD000_15565 [Cyanobacteria bacterium UBA11166]|nr:hypothetical protein [Cyanobacteria bacterium UBA11166]
MRQSLGNHSNNEILYPIPDLKQRVDYQKLMGKAHGDIIYSSAGESNGKFQVIYAGNMSDIYGAMVQDLLPSALVNNEFKFRLFGPEPDWSNSLVAEVKKQGIYAGFISRDLLNERLSQANALLVAMSFKAGDKKRMETSFPSKLVEYCKFGKPIIIWGPEYSSAVRWGSANQAALLVTSPLGGDLVKAIKKLVRDREKQEYLGHKAWAMAQGMFNPENIQRQFAESIERVVANYKL